MNKLIIVLSACLWLLNSGMVFAQKKGFMPGYFIANEGDTVRGYIKFDFENPFEKLPLFKTDQNASEYKELKPDQINAISLEDNQNFIVKTLSLKTDTAKIILRRLVDAELSLYQALNEWNIKEQYFLERNNQLTRINPIGLESFIRVYFKDCTDMVRQPNRYRHNAESLTNLVIQYNQCVYPDAAIDTAKPSKHSWWAGGRIFYHTGALQLQRLFIYDFNKEKKYPYSSFGIGGSFGLQSGKLNIVLEPSYVRQKASKDSVTVGFVFIKDYSSLDFDIAQLELPLLFQYKFQANKIEVFPELGAFTIFSLNPKLEETVIQAPGGTRTPYLNSFERTRFSFGVSAGVGLSVPVKENAQAFLRARYIWIESEFRQQPAITEFQTDLSNRKFEIALGYIFRLNKP